MKKTTSIVIYANGFGKKVIENVKNPVVFRSSIVDLSPNEKYQICLKTNLGKKIELLDIDIPILGLDTKGVRLMKLQDGEYIGKVSIYRICNFEKQTLKALEDMGKDIKTPKQLMKEAKKQCQTK